MRGPVVAARAGAWTRWAVAAALAVIFLLALPGEAVRVGDDVDSAWKWALGQAHAAPGSWERPAHSYGPLGRLLHPLADAPPAVRLFRPAVHLALLGLVLAAFRRAGAAARPGATGALLAGAAPLLGIAASFALVHRTERLWIAATWLALAGALARDLDPGVETRAADAGRAGDARRLLIACGLVAATGFAALVRPSMAIGGVALLATAALLLVAFARPRRRAAPRSGRARRALPVLGSILALTAAAALPFLGARGAGYFPTWRHLGAWLAGLPDVLSGASSALSLPDPDRGELRLGLAVLAAFTAVGATLFVRQRRAGGRFAEGAALVLGLPALALAWKHGFHRQDAHVLTFFAFALLLGGLAPLFRSASPRDRRLAHLPLVVTLLASASLESDARRPAAGIRRPLASGASALFGGARLERALRDLAPERGSASRRFRPGAESRLALPVEWTGRLLAASSLDVLPLRPTRLLAGANGAALATRYRPSPALQGYMAYTPRLDDRMARHFASGGPDVLVAEVAGVDQRPMLWDTPRTWLAVMTGYRVVDRRGGLVLLERRPSPLLAVFGPARDLTPRDEGWFDLIGTAAPAGAPAAPGDAWPWMVIAFEPTPWGRLRDLSLRTEPVFLEVEHGERASAGGGERGLHRLLVANATQGLLAVAPPRDGASLESLLRLRLPPALRRVRPAGAGLTSFGPPRLQLGTLRIPGAATEAIGDSP